MFFVDVAPVIVISIKDRDSEARLCLLLILYERSKVRDVNSRTLCKFYEFFCGWAVVLY